MEEEEYVCVDEIRLNCESLTEREGMEEKEAMLPMSVAVTS